MILGLPCPLGIAGSIYILFHLPLGYDLPIQTSSIDIEVHIERTCCSTTHLFLAQMKGKRRIDRIFDWPTHTFRLNELRLTDISREFLAFYYSINWCFTDFHFVGHTVDRICNWPTKSVADWPTGLVRSNNHTIYFGD